MTDNMEIERFLEDRNRAFEETDYEWAAKRLPPGTHEFTVKIAFHKARFACVQCSDEKRRDSQKFLFTNGLKDLAGNRVRMDDPLPE